MNFTQNQITNVLKLADCASVLVMCEQERKAARMRLTNAYRAWKERHQIDRVERDTLDWVRMTAATKAEFQAFQDTRRAEYNAKRRLRSAVLRVGRVA